MNVHKMCMQPGIMSCDEFRNMETPTSKKMALTTHALLVRFHRPPLPPPLVSLFGTDLTAVCPPGGVPPIVDTCIEIVEDRGIDLEGIYRVGSRQNDIITIKKQFEQGWWAEKEEGISPVPLLFPVPYILAKMAATHKSGFATFLGLLTQHYQGPEGPIRLVPGTGIQLILQAVESVTTGRVLVA